MIIGATAVVIALENSDMPAEQRGDIAHGLGLTDIATLDGSIRQIVRNGITYSRQFAGAKGLIVVAED